jgi:hypothetical protein
MNKLQLLIKILNEWAVYSPLIIEVTVPREIFEELVQNHRNEVASVYYIPQSDTMIVCGTLVRSSRSE